MLPLIYGKDPLHLANGWDNISPIKTNGRFSYQKVFAHGFCVISETADVLYKATDLYNPDDEYGILWSDPDIGIDWPVKVPIVSDKDNQYPRLRNTIETQLPIYE